MAKNTFVVEVTFNSLTTNSKIEYLSIQSSFFMLSKVNTVLFQSPLV